MLPVAVHVPLAGSYSSAVVLAPNPPATKTLPLGSNVAVCPKRAGVRLPVLLNVNGASAGESVPANAGPALPGATGLILALMPLVTGVVLKLAASRTAEIDS